MRILVTGGSGFVGSHIVDALIADGHDVLNVDWLQFGECGARKADLKRDVGGLVRADVGDCDVLVHCAAHADVSRNWDNRRERVTCLRQNVDVTDRVLDVVHPHAHTILLSTCAVYGDESMGREDTAYLSTSPYAASKLAAESLVQAYAHALGRKHHELRLGCVVGARYHHGHVADFVHMARLGQLRPRNNGMGFKSFVHVDDVADAVRLMVNTDDVPAGVYNVVNDFQHWCPRDTVAVMQTECEWPDNTHGWKGDPMAIASGAKLGAYYKPWRTIHDGVKDALTSLGWP